jgi:membrane associated rhomboid family serine protease
MGRRPEANRDFFHPYWLFVPFHAILCWKMMEPHTARPLESVRSKEPFAPGGPLPAWIKVGAIAAASALAGGLAAAWFYRNILNKLRQAESDSENSAFGIQKEAVDNDT